MLENREVVTVDPLPNGSYMVRLWDYDNDNPVVVGYFSYATEAAAHASAVTDALTSWLVAVRDVIA